MVDALTPASINEMARQIYSTSQNILSRIRCQERNGLVSRVKVPQTGQQVKVRVRFVLTDAGKAIVAEGVNNENL